MLTIKNVLIATDFSECSEAALAYGRDLAIMFGARIHVMHVLDVPAADAFTAGYVMSIPRDWENREASAKKRLEALLSDDDRRLRDAKTVLVRLDVPSHAIVDYAASEPIDLIVMGTHGRRALAHVVMGSVAEKVVRTAPCPVLTVRHRKQEATVSLAVAATA
jgi:nucleotide-binding universal stress UspA family protein